ncbi:MAG: tetratricopeptide repeat protein [Chitinophagaceae bacterium]
MCPVPLQSTSAEISIFNYGKLSYELGYQDIALKELKNFVQRYPQSTYNTEAKEILVHLFMNTNDYKNALSYIELIPQKGPDILQAYQKVAYGRAMQLINDQHLLEAQKLLDISLQNPIDQRLQQLAYFWKGEINYRTGHIDPAILNINEYFNLGRINSPASSGEANPQTAHYNLGYCQLRKENYPAALPEFQAAMDPQGPNGQAIANDALLRSADCFFMMKDYSHALSLYEQAISTDQQGADYALYQKGIILGINGHYHQKVALLRQLSTSYPHSAFNNEADYQIALTYLSNEQYTEAIPYLQKVIQEQPNSPIIPKATLKLGLAYFNLNDTSNAILFYKKVVEAYPSSPEASDALQSLRTLYINNGDPGDYLSFLKSTGRQLTPSVEDSITYAAAIAKFGNGDNAGASNAFRQYLTDFPDGLFKLDAHFYLAEGLFNQKDYLNALPNYEYVLSQGSSKFMERSASQAAWINYYQNKNYSRAQLDYQELSVLSTSKENTLTALRGLLLSSFQLQSWNEVKMDAQQLLQQENISTDDQITAHFYLGKAEQSENNCDSAILEFKTVVGLTKSELGAEARYNIAKCYYDQQEWKMAEKASFAVIRNTPSYDYWIAKSYLLLGDIYAQEKDFFNSKATLQSIVDNCKIPDLVQQARVKLGQVIQEETRGSKISNDTTNQ